MGRILLRIAGALAAVAAMLIAFAYLMGVTMMDVTIKHQMQRHVVAEPFEAGHIVALSPDGERIDGLLCNLALAPPSRTDSPVRSRYYNLVDEAQAGFFRFANASLRLVGLSDGKGAEDVTGTSGLPFVGQVSRVVGRFDQNIPISCWCEVARAVLERKQKACVVEKALVATELVDDELRRTVGVSFRADPVGIRDPQALAGFCPGLNTEAIPPANQSCGGSSGFTFDVVARAKVGLIREAPLPR